MVAAANTGARLPLLSDSADRLALFDGADAALTGFTAAMPTLAAQIHNDAARRIHHELCKDFPVCIVGLRIVEQGHGDDQKVVRRKVRPRCMRLVSVDTISVITRLEYAQGDCAGE